MPRLIARWLTRRYFPVLICVTLVQMFATGRPQAAPVLDPTDRIRLAEFYRLNRVLGDSCWPGWTTAPDAVLLVCDSVEFLIHHPAPSTDFESLGYDSLLEGDVLWRPRKFPSNLLATFPAIDATPTIVIGRAEKTDSKTSTPWVTTLAHEHFHQWQMTQSWYRAALDSLDLSGGDKTGMWMLNFPFPYDSDSVAGKFGDLCQRLTRMAHTRDLDSLRTALRAYLTEREQFRNALAPAEFRYFSFQVWQEGFSRYMEWRVADLAASRYKPTKAFRALPDYEPFSTLARGLSQSSLKELSTQKLPDSRRVCFYSFGATEAMILARLMPDWSSQYGPERFRVERLLEMGLQRTQR